MIKLCVFDLDGTLLDTLEDLAVSTNFALQKNGLPTQPIDSYRIFVGNGAKKLIQRAAGIDDPEALEKIKADFDAHYEVHRFDCTRPYEGVREMLDAIEAKGVPMAVLSNKPDEFVGDLMKRYFPKNRFCAVYGKRPGVPTKPDPAALQEVIRQQGVSKEECLYIGDSDVDVFTAHNAGVRCCGAEWGFRGYDELKAAGSDCFAKAPMDVLKAL